VGVGAGAGCVHVGATTLPLATGCRRKRERGRACKGSL